LDYKHNSKTSVVNDHQEDSATNGINEEISHPASDIDMAEQQASSSVSASKIDGHMFFCEKDGHMFHDVKEIDIAIKKSIFTVSNKPSRCVVEWVDDESVSFACSILNPVAQNNCKIK
jgi:hypothetical protein